MSCHSCISLRAPSSPGSKADANALLESLREGLTSDQTRTALLATLRQEAQDWGLVRRDHPGIGLLVRSAQMDPTKFRMLRIRCLRARRAQLSVFTVPILFESA